MHGKSCLCTGIYIYFKGCWKYLLRYSRGHQNLQESQRKGTEILSNISKFLPRTLARINVASLTLRSFYGILFKEKCNRIPRPPFWRFEWFELHAPFSISQPILEWNFQCYIETNRRKKLLTSEESLETYRGVILITFQMFMVIIYHQHKWISWLGIMCQRKRSWKSLLSKPHREWYPYIIDVPRFIVRQMASVDD